MRVFFENDVLRYPKLKRQHPILPMPLEAREIIPTVLYACKLNLSSTFKARGAHLHPNNSLETRAYMNARSEMTG